jgi:hypothetical protein
VKCADRRFTQGVAYPASKVDVHGEYASAKSLELAAARFILARRGVGLQHADGTDGAGEVVESCIAWGTRLRRRRYETAHL